MNVPKNHKAWKRNIYLYFYNATLEDAQKEIERAFDEAAASGVIEPHLTGEIEWGYGGDSEFIWYIQGYVPMTEKEIAAAEKERKRRLEAAKTEKKKKEEKELKEFKRLAKKFKVKVEVPNGS